MSQASEDCPHCSNDEIPIKQSRSRRSHLEVAIVSKPPFIDARIPADKLLDPNERDSQCVNPACGEAQTEFRKVLKKINTVLETVARTGDWTEIETEKIERLEQLGEGALDIVAEQGVKWQNDETQVSWEKIEDKIDKFDKNFSAAAEYTRSLYSLDGTPNPGLEKIPKTASALENLNELKTNINEREQVPDEETTIHENESEEDEQQEREDRIQELEDKLQGERDEKQELRDKLQDG